MNAGMDFNEEALEALNDPVQTEGELSEACQKWTADLLGGTITNINALLERDKGTEREALWREIRAGYEKVLAERGQYGTRVE